MISAAFKDRATGAMWAALFAKFSGLPFEERRNLYRQYICSAAWAQRRALEIAKAGHACTECGLRARQGVPIQVHHRSYKHLGEERPGELVVLCKLCHEMKHKEPDANWIVNMLVGPEDPATEREREANKRRRGHYSPSWHTKPKESEE
jgi:hypothetical protein